MWLYGLPGDTGRAGGRERTPSHHTHLCEVVAVPPPLCDYRVAPGRLVLQCVAAAAGGAALRRCRGACTAAPASCILVSHPPRPRKRACTSVTPRSRSQAAMGEAVALPLNRQKGCRRAVSMAEATATLSI